MHTYNKITSNREEKNCKKLFNFLFFQQNLHTFIEMENQQSHSQYMQSHKLNFRRKLNQMDTCRSKYWLSVVQTERCGTHINSRFCLKPINLGLA